MSADKNRAERRGLAMLRDAARRWSKAIPIHCEGGVSLLHPDLQWLARHGYVEIGRGGGIPKWSREFRRHQGHAFHATPMIRRTCARITAAGWALLARA